MTYDPIITKKQLARALNLTTETVTRWCKKGDMPPLDVDINKQQRGWKKSTLEAAGIKIDEKAGSV